MPDLPTPTASRLTRPSWRDARLVVGVLLVLVATALGARVIAAADETVPMYAAASTLVPGQPLTQQQVRVVRVRLGGGSGAYVAADHPIPTGVFVLRDVRAGELVPQSALGGEQDVSVKPVTLEVAGNAAMTLVQGSVVDVWVNPRDPGSATEKYLQPQRVLEAAAVARTPRTGGAFAGASGTTGVEVYVPEEKVQDLIEAIDQGAKVTLVRAPGSPSAEGS